MADFATCQQELLVALRARIPLICLQTVEPARALELLHTVARWVDGPIYYQHQVRAQPRLLARHHVTLVLTEDGYDVRRLGRLVRAAREHDGVICVITPRRPPGALERLGMLLDLDPPNREEMAAIVSSVLEQYRGATRIEWGPDEVAQAGALLVGFTRREAETQLLRLIGSGSVRRSDVARLVAVREVLVCERSGLERIAAHASLTAWADLEGWPWPRGHSVYRLRLGTLDMRRVVEREAVLAAALSGAERLAPCVLWLDQVDWLNGRRGRPLLGRLLVWLGQPAAGGVVCVGTADDVRLVPAALVRAGRCLLAQLPAGQVRLAQPPAGQAPLAQLPGGQAPMAGQVRMAQLPAGQVPMDATRPVPAGL